MSISTAHAKIYLENFLNNEVKWDGNDKDSLGIDKYGRFVVYKGFEIVCHPMQRARARRYVKKTFNYVPTLFQRNTEQDLKIKNIVEKLNLNVKPKNVWGCDPVKTINWEFGFLGEYPEITPKRARFGTFEKKEIHSIVSDTPLARRELYPSYGPDENGNIARYYKWTHVEL